MDECQLMKLTGVINLIRQLYNLGKRKELTDTELATNLRTNARKLMRLADEIDGRDQD